MTCEVKNVAVIGLGKMGGPISRHLAKGNFNVIGYDISEAVCSAAASCGIKIATSPGEASANADLVIVIVAFEEDVKRVCFGDDGITTRAQPGTKVGVAATISPGGMNEIAAGLMAKGLIPLDIPLCRGERPAEAGQLLITGGGEPAAFEACRPAFATFANSIYRIGPVGSGQVGKMINNMILWACICANNEAFKLAAMYPVDFDILYKMLLDSSASNWAMATRVDEQPMPWAEKDMMIALTEADRLRVALPLNGTVKEVVKSIKLNRNEHFPYDGK